MRDTTSAILKTFVEKANKLKALGFEQHVKETGMGFRFNREPNSEVWTAEFDQVGLMERDAFLLTFRLFILQNEPISFHQIKKFINSPELSSEWRADVGKAIRDFFEYYKGYPENIQDLWGKRPSRMEIVDTVLNGNLAHTALGRTYGEKRRRFEEWTRDPLRKEILFQTFTGIVLIVSAYIYRIADRTAIELENTNLTPPSKSAAAPPT